MPWIGDAMVNTVGICAAFTECLESIAVCKIHSKSHENWGEGYYRGLGVLP